MRDKAGQATQMAKDNPLAAGALVAVLLGTGTGRAVTGSALKLGGLAAIGGLAYKAYQNYQAGKQPTVTTLPAKPSCCRRPRTRGFHPARAPQGEGEFALTLVRAMIAAAKADGHIDDAERRKIGDRLSIAGIGDDAERFLREELGAAARHRRAGCLGADRGTAGRALHGLAAGDRSRFAGRARLSRPACRPAQLPDALVDHVEATVSAVKGGNAAVPSRTPSGGSRPGRSGRLVP